LAAVLDRVERDLTAVVWVLIAISIVVGAAHDLTRALATDRSCVRERAAVGGRLIDRAVAIIVATIAGFEAGVAGAPSVCGAVAAGGVL
jgi:hypothetical protein